MTDTKKFFIKDSVDELNKYSGLTTKTLIILFIIISVLLTIGSASGSLTDDLISYWTFDETSGTLAVDELSIHNGTVNDERVFTTEISGIINTGADFTAGNDNVMVTHTSSLGLTGDSHTISFWVYFDELPTGGARRIITKDTGNDNNGGYAFYLNANNDLTWYIGNTSSQGWTTTFRPSVDTWYHVVAVFEKGVQRKVYVNNDTVLTSTNHNFNPINRGTPDNLYFGIVPGHIQAMNGYMDEVGIWSRALSSSEIQNQLYNDGNGFQYPFVKLITAHKPIENVTLTGDYGTFDSSYYIYLYPNANYGFTRFENLENITLRYTDPVSLDDVEMTYSKGNDTTQNYNLYDDDEASMRLDFGKSVSPDTQRFIFSSLNKYEGDIIVYYNVTSLDNDSYTDNFTLTMKPIFKTWNNALTPSLNFSNFEPYRYVTDVFYDYNIDGRLFSPGLWVENTTLSITGINPDDPNCWNYYANGTCSTQTITSNLTLDENVTYESKTLYPDDLYNEIFFSPSSLSFTEEKLDNLITSQDIHIFNYTNPFSVVPNTTVYFEYYAEPRSVNSFDLQVFLVSKEAGDLDEYLTGSWKTKNYTSLLDSYASDSEYHHEHTALSKHFLTAKTTLDGLIGGLDINEYFYVVMTTSNPSSPRGWNLKYLDEAICDNTGEWLTKQGVQDIEVTRGCPDAHVHIARRNVAYNDGVKVTSTTVFNGYNDTNTNNFYFGDFEVLGPSPTIFLTPEPDEVITKEYYLVSWIGVEHPSGVGFDYTLKIFNGTSNTTLVQTTLTSHIFESSMYENGDYTFIIVVEDDNGLTVITQTNFSLSGEIPGCTYTDALNYDPSATLEDNSCEFQLFFVNDNFIEDIVLGPDYPFKDVNLALYDYPSYDYYTLTFTDSYCNETKTLNSSLNDSYNCFTNVNTLNDSFTITNKLLKEELYTFTINFYNSTNSTTDTFNVKYNLEGEEKEMTLLTIVFILFCLFLVIGLFVPLAHVGTLVLSIFLAVLITATFTGQVAIIMSVTIPVITLVIIAFSVFLASRR